MFQVNNERGQSAVIIAFAVMVLLALVALVVDIGNAYAHRRLVQNACDAAALAGARRLAENGVNDQVVTHLDVLNEIQEYAQENGLDPLAVDAWFIDRVGERVWEVMLWNSPVPDEAQGVEVAGDLPFSTYFAHLLGFDTMQASTNAMVWVLTGPCDGGNLLPITMNVDEIDFRTEYTLWDHDDKTIPGNFGWIYWVDGSGENHCPTDCTQGPQTTVLGPNIEDTSRSGYWSVNDWVQGSVGVNFQPVLDLLARYVQGDETVYIPLYKDFAGTGNNALYQIAGFAEFRLTCAFSSKTHYEERVAGDCDPCNEGSSDEKCIRGEFVQHVSADAVNDGCQDTGIGFLSFRRPRSSTP
jgi:hypothetical protein